MFDLNRLRLLRELARRGTMTAVAEALHLTSSAVSQQLATLEREAGAVLLERLGRGVRLTAEGERLRLHAETILAAVEAAETDLRSAARRPAGILNIASFSTFAKARLLPALLRLRQRHPGLRAILHELESPDAIEAVREGRCDAAITFAYSLVPRSDETAGLHVQLLLQEAVLLALPPSWPDNGAAVALERLTEADWIVGSRQSDDRLLAERACAGAGFAPRIAHAVDDYDLLLRLVAADFGVGFVPALALQHTDAASVIARIPAGLALTRRIQLVTRATRTDSPQLQALRAELIAATMT